MLAAGSSRPQEATDAAAGAPPGDAALQEDPAANPLVLRRLQVLLDKLALAMYPDDQAEEPKRLPVPARGGAVWRRRRPGWTTISFRLRQSFHDLWHAALARSRQRWEALPIWAAVVLLVERVLDVWERQDPTTRPSGIRILERDGYACQAPACSARRGLEVHHIVFRSRGGNEHAWNKITLCHAHHHHAVHAGVVRLTGKAPGRLRWELGRRAHARPRATLQGSKYLARA
jgi:hypothetical protein